MVTSSKVKAAWEVLLVEMGNYCYNISSRGKELNESFNLKLIALTWVIIAIVTNALLIAILTALDGDGLIISMGGSTFATSGAMFLQIWMHVCHESTVLAMNSGLGAFIGYLISSRHGIEFRNLRILACCMWICSSWHF